MSESDRGPRPLSSAARAWLDAYRELDDIPEPVRQRVLTRLTQPLPSRTRPLTWLAVATLGLAAGTILVLVWPAVHTATLDASESRSQAVSDHTSGSVQGRLESRAEASSETGMVREPSLQEGSQPDPQATATPGPSSDRTASEVGPAQPSATTGSTVHGGRKRRQGSSSRPIRRPVSEPDSNAAPPRRDGGPTSVGLPPRGDTESEHQVLGAAWSALAQGDLTEVRTLAREHARRFPRGMLVPEREAIEAIADCKATRDPARGAKFLQDHPRSPLAPHVQAVCGSLLDGTKD